MALFFWLQYCTKFHSQLMNWDDTLVFLKIVFFLHTTTYQCRFLEYHSY